MDKFSIKFLFFNIFLVVFLIIPVTGLNAGCCVDMLQGDPCVPAATDNCETGRYDRRNCNQIQECPQYSSEQKPGSPDKFPNPFGTGSEASDPRVLIGRVIKAVLGIVGSLALLMFIWGGLLWMTSGGNTDRLTKGRNTLIWAALGLAVIFASYALVSFVIDSLAKTG